MRISILKMVNLLALSCLLAFAMASPALADGGDDGHQVQQVDGYEVTLAYEAGEAQPGSNVLNIEITDAQDQPVGGAAVRVVAEYYPRTGTAMEDGMGNQKPTAASTQAPASTVTAEMAPGHETGEYEGELALDKTGHWAINVIFTVQSQERVAMFTAEVAAVPDIRVILGLFLAVNVIIIAIAAITRKKHARVAALEGIK